MAAMLGQTTDATKYTHMHTDVLSKWHQAWWNETNGYCELSYQLMPEIDTAARVLSHHWFCIIDQR
jgi:hypothetical protein